MTHGLFPHRDQVEQRCQSSMGRKDSPVRVRRTRFVSDFNHALQVMVVVHGVAIETSGILSRLKR